MMSLPRKEKQASLRYCFNRKLEYLTCLVDNSMLGEHGCGTVIQGCHDNQSTAAMGDGPGGLGAMTWNSMDHLQSEICQSRTTDRDFCSMGTVLLGVSLYPYSLFGLPRCFPCLLLLRPSPPLTSHLRPPARCSTSRTSQLKVGKPPAFRLLRNSPPDPSLGRGAWSYIQLIGP